MHDAHDMEMRNEDRPEPTRPLREITVRRVVVRFVVGILLIMILLGVSGYLFKEPLTRWSGWFVASFGAQGIMMAFFLADAFLLPIPHEVFTAFGLLGGLSFTEILIWASIGSMTGSTVGFVIGRQLGHTDWFRRLMEGKGKAAYYLAHRYGLWTLAAGAVTPLQYSVCCWACGALGVSYRGFFLVTLLRIPRVAFYTWLVQLGVLNVLG